MGQFERQVASVTGDYLSSLELDVVQVNVGLRCNQQCRHCHVGASPQRTEVMDWPTMEQVIEACRRVGSRLVDLTGGSPEMNPHFRRFVAAFRAEDFAVQVRTNLTALLEPGNEDLPAFLRDHQVQIVASMPCYLEQNVDAQRGKGAYAKSIETIKWLNALGYGRDPALALNLVYNPAGPLLPPPQDKLEADYRRELHEHFGIVFTRLLTITNMPIGRFQQELRRQGEEGKYMRLLKDAFNPDTLDGLMCRHQLSIGWDGTLYDCDFNLALGLPIDHGAPDHVGRFNAQVLKSRRIVVGEHCFGCTAGAGSSCGGALA